MSLSLSLYGLICYTIGFSIAPVLTYLAYRNQRQLLGPLLFFWTTLTLTQFGYVLDVVLADAPVFSPATVSGGLFELLFALLLFLSIPQLILTLTRKMRLAVTVAMSGAVLLLAGLILLTHWTPYSAVIRTFVCFLLAMLMLWGFRTLLKLLRRKTALLNDPIFLVSTFFLALVLLGVVVLDLFYSRDLPGGFEFFPLLYAYTGVFLLYLLHRSGRNIEYRLPPHHGDLRGRFDLTSRELVVLEELLRGIGYREIGDSLSISLNTVRTHVTNIYRKCGVKNRVALIVLMNDL